MPGDDWFFYKRIFKEEVMLKLWFNFITYFYPNDKIASDSEMTREVRLTISFCYIGAIFLFANAVKWNRFDADHIALTNTILGSVLIVISFLYKFNVLSINAINHFIIFSLFADLYFLTFFSGGAESKQIFWVILIPLFAQLLLPGHWGQIWISITLTALGTLFVLNKLNYEFPTVELMNANDRFVGWTMAVFGCLFAAHIASSLFKAGMMSSADHLKAAKEKAETMSINLNSILGQLKDSSDKLNSSSSGLLETSKKLEEDTSMYFNKTSNVYESSQTIRRKVDTVAAEIKLAAKRMGEISKTASRARKIAEKGNLIAKDTSQSMIDLKKSGQDSVNITNMIQQTSNQLKLLSLNAAIEAANAGEHGQGFAIVANQVKNLAERTSEATAEVSQINQNIQNTTDRSAEYITRILDIIQTIFELQQSISAAVEEQNEATKVISKGLSETSEITAFISKNINEVVLSIERTQNEVQKNFSEATGLASMSKSLIQLFSLKESG